MSVTLDIPDSIKQLFADLGSDLARAVFESALIDLYRRGRLSHGELAHALGVGRTQVDGILTRHKVVEDLPTAQEVARQLDIARKKLYA